MGETLLEKAEEDLKQYKVATDIFKKLVTEYKDENERMRNSLTTLFTHCKQYLEEAGGCDHSVGICCCGMIDDIEEAAEILGIETTTKKGD